MSKKCKKVVSILILAFMLLSNLSPIFAIQIGDIADIVNRGECESNVYYENSSGLKFLILTHYVGFYEDGNFYPAYCLNPDLKGVDDEREYGVKVEDMNSIPNNQAVYRVLVNGFPYKTPQEMRTR